MTEKLTPSAVMKAKPKGSKGKSVWPVRFFVDGSYMWGGEKDLKALSRDDAQTYVEKPKNKRDKTLIEAYRVATNPPSMQDLAENADRPQTTKRKGNKRQNEDEATANGKKTAVNKRRKSEVKEDKEPKKKEEEEKPAASDEDAELQIDEVEDNSPEQIKPSFAKLKDDVSGREEQIKIIRHRLQRGFLDSAKPSDSQLPQLSSHIKTLEVNPDLEISIIRKFKVNKVLKQLLKIEDIPSDSFHRFRERAEKLLIRWSASTQETGDDTNGDVTPSVEDKDKKESEESDNKKAESEDKKSDAAASSGVKQEDEPKQEDNKEETKNDSEPNNATADENPAEN